MPTRRIIEFTVNAEATAVAAFLATIIKTSKEHLLHESNCYIVAMLHLVHRVLGR